MPIDKSLLNAATDVRAAAASDATTSARSTCFEARGDTLSEG
jgi:hypothetical protein